MNPALPLCAALCLTPVFAFGQPVDTVPRLGIVSAFAPEWVLLQEHLEGAQTHEINGTRFITGQMEGRDVVLFLSGISMVNAAMTVQLALERFEIEGLVVSGIAGGVDPDLSVGDVVIARQWGQYLEMIYARETEDGFAIPPWMSSDFPNYGMMFVRNTGVARPGMDEPETRFWFDTDPAYLAVAEQVAAEITLEDCSPDNTCLPDPPRVVVSGNGVSGSVFVDNADFREWVFETFEAQVLDMETAAIAHVAYANDVPFIAFRSLSDLAGGEDGANEMRTFMSFAANNSAQLVMAFLRALD